MKAKDKFLLNCDIFKRELADLQAEIDYAEDHFFQVVRFIGI